MTSSASPAPDPSSPPAAPEVKTIWDHTLAFTPVVMTVLATLLAGVSASEMSRAVYHRSVAAQSQSRAGDQWGFFQAKRIRGVQLQSQVDLLPITARPGPLTPDMLRNSAGRLSRHLTDSRGKVESLRRAASTANQAGLAAQAEDFLRELHRLPPEKSLALIEQALEQNREAFRFLGTGELPVPPPSPPERDEFKDGLEDERLSLAVRAVSEHWDRSTLTPVIRGVNRERLQRVIRAAELHATTHEEATESLEKQVSALGAALAPLTRQAALLHRLTLSLEGTGPSDSLQSQESVSGVRSLAELARIVADDLHQLFKAAQHDYTARRYRNNARNNFRTAQYLEVLVQSSTLESDSHIRRSGYFFFGMLVTQCGVAIASLALATQQRSYLWYLATFAGLGAIVFSAYVYLSF